MVNILRIHYLDLNHLHHHHHQVIQKAQADIFHQLLMLMKQVTFSFLVKISLVEKMIIL